MAIAAVGVCFAISCCLPAIHYDPKLSGIPGRGESTKLGIDCLIGVPFACLTVGWWANPALLVGLIFAGLRWWRTALLFAVIGVIASSSLFVSWPVYTQVLPQATVPYYLNDHPWDLLAGFYVWWLSHLLFLAIVVRDIPWRSRKDG